MTQSASERSVSIGIALPIFDVAASEALDAAREAEDRGVDAVFVFDHLASPGNKMAKISLECFSLLGAVATATGATKLGALVAKAWLRPPKVTAQAFASLDEISSKRLIAGLGISDKLSTSEVRRYSLRFPSRSERIAALQESIELLREREISRIWLGGSSRELLQVALGQAESVNLWNASPERVEAVHRTVEELAGEGARGNLPAISWGGDLSLVEKNPAVLRDVSKLGVCFLIVGVPRRSLVSRAVSFLEQAVQ